MIPDLLLLLTFFIILTSVTWISLRVYHRFSPAIYVALRKQYVFFAIAIPPFFLLAGTGRWLVEKLNWVHFAEHTDLWGVVVGSCLFEVYSLTILFLMKRYP